jgi:predicted MFS family arabinose efflux permease
VPHQTLFTRRFTLCWLANFAQCMAFSLFLHFPGFLKEIGATGVQIGWIAGVTAVVSIAVRPTLGSLMDRRGRRGVIIWGGVLNVIVIGLYLTISQIGPWIYLVRAGHGLSEAMLFTAFFTYAADQVPEKRLTQGLAIFGVSGMLPISLAGLLGDYILGQSDFAMLFGVATAIAAVALVLSLPLRDVPRDPLRHAEDPSQGFAAIALQRDLLPIWFVATAFSVALAAMFTFLKPFMMDTGAGTVGVFFSGYTGVAILLRLFLGWLPDRLGAVRVLLPALVLQASGFFLLATTSSQEGVLLAGVLCGAGHGYAFPILFGLVVTRCRDADRGSAMALYTGLFDVGILLGGPSLGYLIDHAGYPTMFATAGGLVVFGAVVFAIWDRALTDRKHLEARQRGAVADTSPPGR